MATNRSLSALREDLELSFAYNMTNAEEFVLLYDANQYKNIYPYWKYKLFDIGTIDEEQCFIDFRLAKNDLHVLVDVLNIPDRVITTQGTVYDGMGVLCILSKRLSFPCHYSDMTPIFGRNPTELCLIYNSLVNKIYDQHYHRVSSWNQPLLVSQQLQLYADVIHEKG